MSFKKSIAAVLATSALFCMTACNDGTKTDEPTGSATITKKEEPADMTNQTEASSTQEITDSKTEEITESETEEIITTEAPATADEPFTLTFPDTSLYGSALDPKSGFGQTTAYSCWVSTDFIDVSKYFALKYELSAHRYLCSVSFFDKDKKFIDGISTGSYLGATTISGIAKLPDGAVYARFIEFTGSSGSKSFSDCGNVSGVADEYSYNKYIEAHPYSGMKIVCLGDSLTEGDTGTAVHGKSDKRYENYPFYLAREFGCNIDNQGKCGITPANYLSFYSTNVKNADIADADVILIMLGTNGGLTDATQLSSYNALLTMLSKDKKDSCKIVLMTPPQSTTDSTKANYGYAEQVSAAAEAIRNIAKTKGLPLIDINKESPIQKENEAVYQPNDGLHLGTEGYRVLSAFIAEKLAEILG